MIYKHLIYKRCWRCVMETNETATTDLLARQAYEDVLNTSNYVKDSPWLATAEVMLCPAFTVGHNLKNVSLQIFVQLYLMNRLDDINKLQTILNSDDKTTALKKFLDELYAVFSRIAEIVPHKAPENTTQEEDDEKAIEAKQSALKKLKKQIHFFAELNGVDLKNNASTRIVNFQKLRERFERDQVRLQELYRLEEMTKKDNIELSSLI